MPAQSKQQQKFMGIVRAIQKGDIPASDASPEAQKVAKSMKKSDVKDFASTKHKGLPRKVKQEILNRLKEYANKMGTDHLGGDDYTSSKKGGLRDFDGYDNVDYNKDMPMDEAHYTAVANLGTKKSKENLDSFDELQKFMDKMKKRKAISVQVTKINNGKKQTIDYDWDGRNWVSKNKKGVQEAVDYKYLTQTLLDAKPKYNVYYNSGHNKVNIGGVGYDGGDLVKNFNQKPGSSSKIKNNFYYADQDPQKTKKEVEKLSKGKIKVDIQKGYGGKPIPVYIVKESVEEGKMPNNWMTGRVSDYHTALRGKNKDYSGGTNFKKTNHGQPDIENDDEDQETNQLSNKQTSLKAESFDKVEHLKLLNLALKAMPGSQKQKEIIRKLNQVRKAGGMRPLKEAPIHSLAAMNATRKALEKRKVKNPKTGNDVAVTTALKDKDHPAHNQAKSLFQRLKSKLMGEYGQRLDLSYLEDEEARLDGTPEPKDAINRDLDEGTMIRRAVDIAQELLPKDTWSRFASDGKKNAEFVKNVVRDLAQSLNRFYKNHNINVRLKEEEGNSNVDMVLGVLSILRQIDDKENRKRVAVDMIKKFKEQDIDFDYQEFIDLMKEYSMGSYEYNK